LHKVTPPPRNFLDILPVNKNVKSSTKPQCHRLGHTWSSNRYLLFLGIVPDLDESLLIASTVSSALTRLVTAPFRSRGPLGLYKDVFFAAIREMLSNITIPQSRYIFGTTTDVYRDFCTQQHLAENTVQVGGVASHWIGREDADVIILYFHGEFSSV